MYAVIYQDKKDLEVVQVMNICATKEMALKIAERCKKINNTAKYFVSEVVNPPEREELCTL